MKRFKEEVERETIPLKLEKEGFDGEANKERSTPTLESLARQ